MRAKEVPYSVIYFDGASLGTALMLVVVLLSSDMEKVSYMAVGGMFLMMMLLINILVQLALFRVYYTS